MKDFATRLIAWQRLHGRNTLPWQGWGSMTPRVQASSDGMPPSRLLPQSAGSASNVSEAHAYRVWLSEIMLQQTQVATVIPYYQRFAARFPDVAALASASEEQVLAHWSGLGYYARGRNLHRAARQIMQQHGGRFPAQFDEILALPGIGRSTAAAICALAFGQRRAILDGNVKRVLTRHCAIEGYPGDKKIESKLWEQAEALLPAHEVNRYTQGLMDLGATICTRTRPGCEACPVRQDCIASREGRIAQLPTPRPKKVLPEKHSTFLLLLNGSDILLEKRPPQGIWGGLWCMPQLDATQDAAAYCLQNLSVPAGQMEALPSLTHNFTHFRLHITPLLVQLACPPEQARQPGSMWLDVEDALQAAIPVPVRKLLQQLQARRILKQA